MSEIETARQTFVTAAAGVDDAKAELDKLRYKLDDVMKEVRKCRDTLKQRKKSAAASKKAWHKIAKENKLCTSAPVVSKERKILQRLVVLLNTNSVKVSEWREVAKCIFQAKRFQAITDEIVQVENCLSDLECCGNYFPETRFNCWVKCPDCEKHKRYEQEFDEYDGERELMNAVDILESRIAAALTHL